MNEEPDLRVAVDHASLDYELAHDPDQRELTVVKDPDAGDEISAYYRVPRSASDLAERSRLIETVTALGRTIPPLIKEIGTDALFALQRVLAGDELERARAFYRHCRDADLAVAVAQTDPKGDRSLAPHAQADPDLYVHVVDERDDGIVVRGAKCHTSASPNAHEIVVLPTRAMGPDDSDYAVSFAVPVATPGLTLYVSSYSAGARDPFEFPASSTAKMLETLTVFDDVFVPWERVFLFRRPEAAGPLALSFVDFHRFTAVSYKLPLLDAFVGAAVLLAQSNGIMKASHVRDKLVQLVTYAETVRGLTELAATRAKLDEHGIAFPDPMTTNMAKYTFASGYHHAIELVQEIAGGLLVTAPGGDDWASPDVRPVLEKYFRAAGSAEERLRLFNLVSDLTTRDFGGYHAVLAVHAEGSVEAEKTQIFRSYDSRRALDRARYLARLP